MTTQPGSPADAGWRRQDLISRGMGSAARAIGLTADAYRPSGAANPLADANRYLRLPVAFADSRARFTRPVGYAEATYDGIFDTAYTRPGDYLVRPDATWFIGNQPQLLPPLCVRTNRIVSFTRPAGAALAGVNAYGGVDRGAATALLTAWPASVLGAAAAGRPEADLPSDQSVPVWSVLLPAWPGILLRPADLMTDDLGRAAILAAAELTELGWRLTVRQAIT